jgi:hypothetical protein
MSRSMWGVSAWITGGVWALAVAILVPVAQSAPGPALRHPSAPPASRAPYSTDSLARIAIARDLFRVGRRPAPVAYDPQRLEPPVESSQPPKPALMLVGVIAGDEPTAVIDGFPGVEGSRVVRVGDVIAGLVIKAIALDAVRIAGMDTVWVLRVREPWK